MATAKPDTVQPISESRMIRMLLYGHPGIGKTALIGTGPKPMLIIRPPTDLTDSIKNPKGVEERVVTDWSDMDDVHEFLRMSEGAGFKWVWLDSISGFQDFGLDDIWAAEVARKPARAEFGLDKGEYGRNQDRLSRWVRYMSALSTAGYFNFGVVAHAMEVEDPVDEELKLGPWIRGKNMAYTISGYMNVVGYLRVGKKERRYLHTRSSDKFIATDKFEAIEGGKMMSPTMPKIIEAIEASRAADTRSKRTPTKRKRRTKRQGGK